MTLRLPIYVAGLIIIATLVLSGCGMLLGVNRQPLTLYDPHIQITPDPAWPKVNWQLAVVKPIAGRTLDSPRIQVRPNPAELQVYAGVAWSQPAPDLLQAALVQAFEDSGRITAVARANTGIHTDYRLITELRRFEADYHTAKQPFATVEISAKLINQRNQRIIAARSILVSEMAAGTDSASVVSAFEIVLSQAVSTLVGWTLHSGQADQHPPSVFKSADPL